MRLIITASMFGISSLLANSTIARAAGAAEQVSSMADGQIDVVAVGVLVVMGIGLAALAYKLQSTA